MKPTLKDIAKDTGYSISTVSRVLSGSKKISLKTRKEIFISAEKLNYPIKSINLDRNKTSSEQYVALMTDIEEGEFFASYFRGFSQAIAQSDMKFAFLNITNPERELRDVLIKMLDDFFCGAILFFPKLNKSSYKEIFHDIPSSYPIVSNSLIDNPVVSTITFDGYMGGHLAAEYIEDRYSTAGVIKGPFEKPEVRFRYNGFKDHLSQSKFTNLIWEFSGDFTFESGMEAFKEYNQLERKPRAIFACNDSMASGFLEMAKINGYGIPNDVAILGYDDLPICNHMYPKLTSVSTDFVQLGYATLQALEEKINRPNYQNDLLRLVSVSLEERETS